MATVVTSQNYTETVEKSALPVLLDVWAAWCGPCRALEPIIEELEKTYAGKIAFAKLNADDEQELSQRLAVYGLPTIRLFKAGKMVFEAVGLPEKSKLVAALDAAV